MKPFVEIGDHLVALDAIGGVSGEPSEPSAFTVTLRRYLVRIGYSLQNSKYLYIDGTLPDKQLDLIKKLMTRSRETPRLDHDVVCLLGDEYVPADNIVYIVYQSEYAKMWFGLRDGSVVAESPENCTKEFEKHNDVGSTSKRKNVRLLLDYFKRYLPKEAKAPEPEVKTAVVKIPTEYLCHQPLNISMSVKSQLFPTMLEKQEAQLKKLDSMMTSTTVAASEKVDDKMCGTSGSYPTLQPLTYEDFMKLMPGLSAKVTPNH